MDVVTNIAESIPFIKNFADSRKINPAYILLALAGISLFIIQKTFFGGLLTAILCLYMPVREAILSVQSPNPKISDLKRLLTVFIMFSGFYLLECIGIYKIIPLFSIMKILIIFWTGFDERHANVCNEMIFSRIPTNWLHCGNSIEAAVKKAAKSVEVKVSNKND